MLERAEEPDGTTALGPERDGSRSSPRLLIYSQDGLGLGHLRRTTLIASEFQREWPDAAVLTIQDSPLGNFFPTAPNHDFVKLPSIEKVAPGRWRAVDLPLPFDEVRTIREQIIRSTVRGFRPDLLLVDHMPHGAMGELRPALEALHAPPCSTRMVLGLRDILDAPEVIRDRWRVERAYDAIDRFYDLVLIYGNRDVFDIAEQYDLSARAAAKVRYCGYVCAPQVVERPSAIPMAGDRAEGTRTIVATAGGGADAASMFEALLEATPLLLESMALNVVMITGPMMPAQDRSELVRRSRGSPVEIRPYVPDARRYIEAADLVVARAGYNTTVEILRSGRPGVLVPRPGPSAEQRTRARLFGTRGWVQALDPDALSPRSLAEAILRALDGGRTDAGHEPAPSATPDLRGLQVAVRHLTSLLVTADGRASGSRRATSPGSADRAS